MSLRFEAYAQQWALFMGLIERERERDLRRSNVDTEPFSQVESALGWEFFTLFLSCTKTACLAWVPRGDMLCFFSFGPSDVVALRRGLFLPIMASLYHLPSRRNSVAARRNYHQHNPPERCVRSVVTSAKVARATVESVRIRRIIDF